MNLPQPFADELVGLLPVRRGFVSRWGQNPVPWTVWNRVTTQEEETILREALRKLEPSSYPFHRHLLEPLILLARLKDFLPGSFPLPVLARPPDRAP